MTRKTQTIIKSPPAKLCSDVDNLLKKATNKQLITSYNNYTRQLGQSLFNEQHEIITRINTIHQNILSRLSRKTNNITPGQLIQSSKDISITITEQPLTPKFQIPRLHSILEYLISHQPDIFPKYGIPLPEIQKLISNHSELHHNLHQNSNLAEKVITLLTSIISSSSGDILAGLSFHTLLYNSFTSFMVLKHLEEHIRKLFKISITYNGKNYNDVIYLFGYTNLGSPRNKFYKYIESIICRVLFFNEFLETDQLPDKMVFFITNMKKEINLELEHTAHFKSLHVNSAVMNGIEVIIYRQEELLKSIFHELIHYHNLDFKTISGTQYRKLVEFIQHHQNISSQNKFLFYECITESLANILNNIFNCSGNREIGSCFIKNYSRELLFTTFQISKILNICGYHTWAEFCSPESHKISGSRGYKYKQDSCVFSYYILKLYILLNANQYFKMCLDSQLRFIKNDNSIDQLVQIFKSSRDNIYLANMVNAILEYFKHSRIQNKIQDNIWNGDRNITRFLSKTRKSHMKSHMKSQIKSEKLYKTLRMTCLG